jgi:hypothetical protein
MPRLAMNVMITSVKADPTTGLHPVIGLEQGYEDYAIKLFEPDAHAANQVWTAELSLRQTSCGILMPHYQFSMAIGDGAIALAAGAAQAPLPVCSYEEDAPEQLLNVDTTWSDGRTLRFGFSDGADAEGRVLELRGGSTTAGTPVQLATAQPLDSPDIADQQWSLQQVRAVRSNHFGVSTSRWNVLASGGYGVVGYAYLTDGQPKPALSWKRP